MEEEWKIIEGFPDYQVSNMGRVKSMNYNHTGEEQILKLRIRGKYPFVDLYKDKVRHQIFVHRLVGTAFVPNPENKPQIDHLDRNKLNNNKDNLCWKTASENCLNRKITLLGTNTDERYISFDKNNKRYVYQKRLNNISLKKSFKTLEEAIAYRDNLLAV